MAYLNGKRVFLSTAIIGSINPDADGYSEGYEAGLADGYSQGQSDGYDNGYAQGHNQGLNEGYNNGYGKGYDDGVAVYEEDYTNVVLTAQDPSSDQVYNGVGYRNDWRLTNGGGYAYSGYVSVGLVDYVVPNSGLPPTIYIKGNISLDSAIMTLWKQNKVYGSEISNLSASTTYFEITKIKEGYFKLVPIANSNGRSPIVDNMGTGMTYASFVFKCTGESLVISLNNPIASAVENAYEQGKQAEYDAFWDAYQDYGNRRGYALAFGGQCWAQGGIFKPKYPIVVDYSYRMFESSYLTDVSNVDFDFSECTNFTQTFAGSKITGFKVIDTRSASSLNYLLYNANKMVSVEKVILKDDGSQVLGITAFQIMTDLVDISFEGAFGDNFGFPQSSNLSNTSVQNIIDHLKSGVAKTVTFHADVKARMTDAQKAQITAKNWTLA